MTLSLLKVFRLLLGRTPVLYSYHAGALSNEKLLVDRRWFWLAFEMKTNAQPWPLKFQLERMK